MAVVYRNCLCGQAQLLFDLSLGDALIPFMAKEVCLLSDADMQPPGILVCACIGGPIDETFVNAIVRQHEQIRQLSTVNRSPIWSFV